MTFLESLEAPIGDSRHFKWREALYLREWQIYAFPTDAFVIQEIEKSALKMDLIREFFKKPVIVTSWFRPPKYNVEIGGAPKSKHVLGMAVDFQVKGMDAEVARTWLEEKLVEFNLRMENLPKSNWVHIDTACVASDPKEKRFFQP